MVRASVVLCTKRQEPHLNWALRELKKQTFKDFEYIVVDGLYYQRKRQVLELIEKESPPFDVIYIPDKPSPWLGKRPALCNARNTALIVARGRSIVFHDDCCIEIKPDWLERHVRQNEANFGCAGTWFTYQKCGQGLEVGPYGYEFRRKQFSLSPVIVEPSWLHGGNMSFPLQAALDVNGFDEIYDGELGCDDCDFGIRISRAGYSIVYDPLCEVRYCLDTHELIQYSDDPKKDIWVKAKDLKKPKEKLLSDGKMHFSNEWLIQLLNMQQHRYLPLGNSFWLPALRELYHASYAHLDEGFEKFIDEELWKWAYPFEHDWRDGERISEM